MRTLWILGDQLSPENAALAGADPADSTVLLVESKARGGVVRYHQQKLVLVYSGMRHFARDLRAAGWRVATTSWKTRRISSPACAVTSNATRLRKSCSPRPTTTP